MDRIRISLAAARVNAGLSQKESAKRMHTSVKTIQNHESGKTIPGWKTAERYASLYGIPLDYIFFGCNSAKSEETEEDETPCTTI
jgi:DNA-binding XRE family transcriptional regulator